MTTWWLSSVLCLLSLSSAPDAGSQQPVVVASKKFTESVILGETARLLATNHDVVAEHRREMGGTRIVFNALEQGQVDVYPEYTGTIMKEIFAELKLESEEEMREALAQRGILATDSLGFNNTYAIGVNPLVEPVGGYLVVWIQGGTVFIIVLVAVYFYCRVRARKHAERRPVLLYMVTGCTMLFAGAAIFLINDLLTPRLEFRDGSLDHRGIRSISDLRDHPQLRLGFTNEFMEREDGWPALRRRYNLPQPPGNVRGLDHDIALRALAEGSIDATDLYSTDAEIAYYGFSILEDDLSHFPRYDALFLYRAELKVRAPQLVRALHAMAGRIDEPRMVEMNKRAKIDKESESRVAADFLREELGIQVLVEVETFAARQLRWLCEHLNMVVKSMVLAVLVAVPMGIVAAKCARTGQAILGIAGIIQTIPALALLVLLMPLPWPREAGRPNILGVGTETAIAALFLYSLLPIVRNTQTGLVGIGPAIRESAEALGLSAWSKLVKIDLPLASRTILAGIKTAAVINVGFATLGALIDTGGYGQPIITGIRRAEMRTIFEGAVPAALLALLVQGLFELAERFLVPRGLRLKPAE